MPLENRQNDKYIDFQRYFTQTFILFTTIICKSFAFKRMMTDHSRVILWKIRTIGLPVNTSVSVKKNL